MKRVPYPFPNPGPEHDFPMMPEECAEHPDLGDVDKLIYLDFLYAHAAGRDEDCEGVIAALVGRKSYSPPLTAEEVRDTLERLIAADQIGVERDAGGRIVRFWTCWIYPPSGRRQGGGDGGGTEIPHVLIDDPGVSIADKGFYMLVARHLAAAGEDDPDVIELARLARLDRGGTHRALKRLERAGYVTVARDAHGRITRIGLPFDRSRPPGEGGEP